MVDRRPYSMTALEYRVLKGEWTDDNHMLYVDTVERCYEEGWVDVAGNLTQKGSIAVGLYETFKQEWPDDDELDDDIPWEGDSVLFLDHYRLSDAPVGHTPGGRAAPANTSPAASAGKAANDSVVLPVASRGNGHLAAPEGVECA